LIISPNPAVYPYLFLKLAIYDYFRIVKKDIYAIVTRNTADKHIAHHKFNLFIVVTNRKT